MLLGSSAGDELIGGRGTRCDPRPCRGDGLFGVADNITLRGAGAGRTILSERLGKAISLRSAEPLVFVDVAVRASLDQIRVAALL